MLRLFKQIFDLLNTNGINSISQTNPKLLTLVQETGLYKKKLEEFHAAWYEKWNWDI
jgi:hypothetical protein